MAKDKQAEKKKKKKNKPKRTLRLRFLRLIFLLLVIYFSYNIIGTQIDIYREKKTYEDIQRRIDEQLLLRDDLNRHLNSGNESDYIERIAREKLGYAAPDEQVFVDS